MLSYGNEKIYFEDEQLSVSEFIVSELKADKIKIENHPHNLIYHEIERLINSKQDINESFFITHNDMSVNKLCADLLTNQHIISDNWVLRHKIYTGRENQNLKKTAEKAVLILKLQHVESKIKLIQQEIKEQNTKDEDFMLLNNLIKIKNKISLKIGRSSF